MHIDSFIERLTTRRLLQLRPFDPSGGEGSGTGGHPYNPPVGKSTIQGSPGLLTSTGGLIGTNFALLMPVFDIKFQKTYLAFIDSSDFNTEDDCFYTFRQEDVMINRKVSVHLLVVTYREIAKATFTIGVQVFMAETNSFKISSKEVKIDKPLDKKAIFPSGSLKTKKIPISVIAGERPQVFISRKADSGALAITRVMMVGKADEKDLM